MDADFGQKPGSLGHPLVVTAGLSQSVALAGPGHPPAQGPAASGEQQVSPRDVEEAYVLYVDVVWSTLKRLGVPQASLDDALQDVFVTAHRRWDDFRHASSRRTWVIGIALRTAANYRRQRQREVTRHVVTEVEPADTQTWGPAAGEQPSAPSAFELCARREASAFLQEFLAQLPESQRDVFVLVDLEQLTIREAAAACSAPFSAAYRRLQIARERFNEAVRRYRAADQRRFA